MCNITIIYLPTSPKYCCYTTLGNIRCNGWSQSGNGAESGDSKNRFERGSAILPLTLRSHALQFHQPRAVHACTFYPYSLIIKFFLWDWIGGSRTRRTPPLGYAHECMQISWASQGCRKPERPRHNTTELFAPIPSSPTQNWQTYTAVALTTQYKLQQGTGCEFVNNKQHHTNVRM